MEAQSAFQAVEVINTSTYGKMLMLESKCKAVQWMSSSIMKAWSTQLFCRYLSLPSEFLLEEVVKERQLEKFCAIAPSLSVSWQTSTLSCARQPKTTYSSGIKELSRTPE